MRLIDADKLLKLIKEQKVKETGVYTRGLNTGLNIVKSIINDETQTPTAYDINEVVEQLYSQKKYSNPYDSYYNNSLHRLTEFENERINKTINDAIEIVKAGGIDER